MAGWLQFSPHRRLAEQLLLLIIPGMGFGFSVFLYFFFFFFFSPLLSFSPPSPVSDLVCPVWRSAIGGFGSLRLLLHGAGLVALTRSTLEIKTGGDSSQQCTRAPRGTSPGGEPTDTAQWIHFCCAPTTPSPNISTARTPTATTTRSRSAGTHHPSHPALKVPARCHHPDAVTPSLQRLIAEGWSGNMRR